MHETNNYGLELCGISKIFGQNTVVNDVSLTVKPGQFLTLLGPSGSGKTTLLMLIAGFVQPSRGVIFLDGREITNLPAEKRNFGMVFQGYALFPHMNVAQNIAFPLKVRGQQKSDIDKGVMSALKLVQLEHLASRKPNELSGGQQQRVALARAMVFDPLLLLLDEPLSALDRKLRAELQIELKSLHERIGMTFIYVTHDQDEALSMSDEIIVLNHGKIAQRGTPQDLYERPNSRFVANFMGGSNFLQGVVLDNYRDYFNYKVNDEVFKQDKLVADVKAGEGVLISISPERMNISDAEPREGENFVRGKISNFSYFGSNFHFFVYTDCIGEIDIITPTSNCHFEPVTSKPVWVSWRSNDSVPVADNPGV